jgi:hypothetical protein
VTLAIIVPPCTGTAIFGCDDERGGGGGSGLLVRGAGGGNGRTGAAAGAGSSLGFASGLGVAGRVAGRPGGATAGGADGFCAIEGALGRAGAAIGGATIPGAADPFGPSERSGGVSMLVGARNDVVDARTSAGNGPLAAGCAGFGLGAAAGGSAGAWSLFASALRRAYPGGGGGLRFGGGASVATGVRRPPAVRECDQPIIRSCAGPREQFQRAIEQERLDRVRTAPSVRQRVKDLDRQQAHEREREQPRDQPILQGLRTSQRPARDVRQRSGDGTPSGDRLAGATHVHHDFNLSLDLRSRKLLMRVRGRDAS